MFNLKSFLARFRSFAPSATWRWFGHRSSPQLGYEAAFKQVGYVYRCVRAIATNIAQVPVKAVRVTKDRVLPLPSVHPLSQLLAQPNSHTDFSGIVEAIVMHLNLRGEALLEIEGGRLFVYPPQFIQKVNVADDNSGYINFEMNVNGKAFTVPAEDAVFFKLYDPENPWRGQAPMQAALLSATTDYNTQKFNARFFAAAPSPSMVLRKEGDTTQNLTPEEKERIQAQLSQMHGGVDRAHSILVLGPNEKLETVGLGVKDMSFAKLREFDRDDIRAVFGVPPILLGDIENANRANSQSQLEMFWQQTLVPIIQDIESLLNQRLAKRFGPDVKILFDLQAVPALQKDMGRLTEWALPAIESGALTINEFRQMLDRPPVPWGDQWWHGGTDVSTGEVGVDADPLREIDEQTTKEVFDMFRKDVEKARAEGDTAPANLFNPSRAYRKAMRRFDLPLREAMHLAKKFYEEEVSRG